MARIELSAGMANTVSQRMMRNGSPTGTDNQVSVTGNDGAPLFAAGTGAGYTVGLFYIMGGVMPTDTSSLTTTTARASDVLVTFNGANANIYAGVLHTTNQTTFALPYVTASASGTATWFWICSKSSATNATTVYHSIIGSIGGLGSGADLEVNSTDVVSGQQYRVTNLRITWPTYLDY